MGEGVPRLALVGMVRSGIPTARHTGAGRAAAARWIGQKRNGG
jgi:hypothetical protein